MPSPITTVDLCVSARCDGEHATTLSASASAATRRLMAHLPRPCGSCRSRRSACCGAPDPATGTAEQSRSEEHTSELQSLRHLVCRLLLEKKKKPSIKTIHWIKYDTRL